MGTLVFILSLVFTGVTSGTQVSGNVQVDSLADCASQTNDIIEASQAGIIKSQKTGEVYVLTSAECKVVESTL